MKNKNIFTLLLLLLIVNKLSLAPINAQGLNSFEQNDTLRICDSPNSSLFIFDIKSNEINTKEGIELVTNVEIHNYRDNSLFQKFSDTSDSGIMAGEIEFVDINFDGCKDIDIHTGGFNLVPTHSFWLFDKLKKKYYYSFDYSELKDYAIYSNNEIKSTEQSVGGRGGYSETYKIENGNMKLIETTFSNYYDYEKKEIVNGKLATVSKTESHEDDNKGVSIIELDKYNLAYDSLVITEKKWMMETNESNTKMVNSSIYNCDWGRCYKYLRKEIYSYQKIKNQLIKKSKKYQVINDNWQIVREFKK